MLQDQSPRDPIFLLKCAQLSCSGYLEGAQMAELYGMPMAQLVDIAAFDGTTAVPRICASPPICFSIDRGLTLDVECYAWTNADELYFTFQGTVSNVDVLTDLRFNLTDFSLPRLGHRFDVHAGFAGYFAAVERDIDSIIAEHKPKRILFTGHSMAASMAELATLRFADLYPNIQLYCITFGAPRTGCGRAYAATLDAVSKHARVVGYQDPVPCVPLPLPYLHSNGVRLAPSSITEMRRDSGLRLPVDLVRALWALLKKSFGRPVTGHKLLDAYIPMLTGLAGDAVVELMVSGAVMQPTVTMAAISPY
jgi:hypothetical protein